MERAMAKHYTHDFADDYDTLEAKGMWNFEITDALIKRFEQQAAEYLRGCKRDNVGGVVIYIDKAGEEAAYFDYENCRGNVYAVNARRSWEL
jgi:hypothetical protein